MGTASYGITLPPAVAIVETLAPEEGEGALRSLPYAALTPGHYTVTQPLSAPVSPELRAVLMTYARLVEEATVTGALPQAQAFLDIIERQADLKAVTLRIQWQPSDADKPGTFSRTLYVHRNRNALDDMQDASAHVTSFLRR